jgi:hypothetical protein
MRFSIAMFLLAIGAVTSVLAGSANIRKIKQYTDGVEVMPGSGFNSGESLKAWYEVQLNAGSSATSFEYIISFEDDSGSMSVEENDIIIVSANGSVIMGLSGDKDAGSSDSYNAEIEVKEGTTVLASNYSYVEWDN